MSIKDNYGVRSFAEAGFRTEAGVGGCYKVWLCT